MSTAVMEFTPLDADAAILASLAGATEDTPAETAEDEARRLTAQRLRPFARRQLLRELEAFRQQRPTGDERDWISALDLLLGEYHMKTAAGVYPVPVFEEYSPDTKRPRSALLLEAFSFFVQLGRTAVIMDSEPWLEAMPQLSEDMPRNRDRRPGHTAVLLVF